MKKRGSRTILDTDSAGLDDGGELSISRAPPLPRQKSPITQFLEPMFPCQVSALPCSGIMIKCCWCSSKSPRENLGKLVRVADASFRIRLVHSPCIYAEEYPLVWRYAMQVWQPFLFPVFCLLFMHIRCVSSTVKPRDYHHLQWRPTLLKKGGPYFP